jgi:hypothetical protein
VITLAPLCADERRVTGDVEWAAGKVLAARAIVHRGAGRGALPVAEGGGLLGLLASW